MRVDRYFGQNWAWSFEEWLLNVHLVLFLLKKFHYLCLSFLEDNSFVDRLVKERLVANKLKEKRTQKTIWFQKEMVWKEKAI